MMALRLLILGGTTEASALAAALATHADIQPTLSLAGRTANPRPAPIPTRVGGFGGVSGMIEYLGRERVAAVIDATHPFAEQISANAALACAAAEIPLLAFTRPPWTRRPGDRWIEVESVEAAVAALGETPRRVFLTHGRLQLAAFARAPQHRYLVRAIDPPAEIGALPFAESILARGPFSLADEEKLMREEGVEVLVTKNSGGGSTYAKIEAARRLGVNVVVINRPAPPVVGTIASLDDALAWIEAQRS
jgi:precorrin-6A/cobalt-precorrin-6A reductase